MTTKELEALQKQYRRLREERRDARRSIGTDAAELGTEERLELGNPYYSPNEVRGEWQTMTR